MLRQDLTLNLEFTNWLSLLASDVPESPSSSLTRTGALDTHANTSDFHMGSGIQRQGLMLVQQAFTSGAISPAFNVVFFKSRLIQNRG